MKVPCPVPLQSPWSPVGYQVVEVADEKVPAIPVGRQTSRSAGAGPKPAKVAQSAVPSSPLGYRVIQVAEEKSPEPPPALEPKVEIVDEPSPREITSPSPAVVWGSIAAGGLCLLVLLAGWAMVSWPGRVQETLPAPMGPEPVAMAPAKPVAGRDTFGTAVHFARNPREAAGIARAQHKLTFILHVSGNFEDCRFT
jgi:hypothetical protein